MHTFELGSRQFQQIKQMLVNYIKPVDINVDKPDNLFFN